ncbi:MAG: hypothetical protein WA687_07715 [Solirubrobacterales bacterium]
MAELPSSDGGSHIVVEGQTASRSLLAAQAFAARMLATWAPRSLVIADCGGGLEHSRAARRQGLALGDVVVSELLHYHELQKLKPGSGPEGERTPIYIRWQPISPRLSAAARDLDELEPSWRERLRTTWPDDGRPEIKYGELVCGDKLLGNPKAPEVVEIIDRYERALAVDMETVGVAHAALEAADDGLALSFVALRGISDWIDGDANQETRDTWKGPACEAAVAAAIGLIGATPAIAAGGSKFELDSRRKLRERLTSLYTPPERPFESQVRAGTRRLTPNDALTLATEGEGVALIGDAGMGKSSMLHNAVLASMSPLDPFPVLIDLKRWRPEYGKRLAADPSGDDLLPSLDSLLRAAVQKIGSETLEEIAANRPVMVFVDGLNEVPFSETGRPILTLLDEYMRKHPKLRVLVTDRTAGEFYADNGWQTMRLEPLDADEVYRVVLEQLKDEDAAREAHDESLLRTPFFLDRALLGGKLALASRASAVGDFFARHLDIEGNDLKALAKAAFDVYVELRQRTFPVSAIAPGGDSETLRKLKVGGAVTGEDDVLTFDHQIEHDFLAALHLAGEPSSWTSAAFDALTFDAAAFDVLGLALEQIDSEEECDAFLRSLYNWNWRGTIAALAAAEQDGSAAASVHLRTALLAVIAEKMFDPVDGTRQRSADQLRSFAGGVSTAMAAVSSLDELATVVAAQPAGPAWFEDWRSVFCRLPGDSPLGEGEIARIGRNDPVIGWTTANVVRRFPIDPDASRLLRAIYSERAGASPADRATRWRVVHALGAWPDHENGEILRRALDDEYMWVIYGAVRSLTEMAAISQDIELRDEIVAGLDARLGDLPPEPLSQIAYTSRYGGADHDYADAIRPLLGRILAAQSNESERRLWSARIERFEEFWARDVEV